VRHLFLFAASCCAIIVPLAHAGEQVHKAGGVDAADISSSAARTASILSANHAATAPQGCPRQGTLRQQLTSTAYGMDMSITSSMDLQTGFYIDRQDGGQIHLADGFDGRIAWQQDLSGTIRTQGGGAKPAQAISQAYRNAALWWASDRGHAAIIDRGTTEVRGRRFDILDITPRGGQPFTAWFDAQTHLLESVLQSNGADTTTISFSDYRSVSGCMLPGKTVVDEGYGEQYRHTAILSAASITQALPQTAYAAPQRAITDFSFSGHADRVTVPFRLQNNHIVTDVKINGQGPFNIILDTGGMAALTPATAKALAVASRGNAPVTGVGSGVDSTSFAHDVSFQIGGLTLHGQTALVSELEAPQPNATALHGMLGYELFRRVVVQVNYRDQTLTLIDPAKFEPAGAGTRLHFDFTEHMPEVAGSFDGISGRFRVDTGARSELTLSSPFVEEHQVLERYPHSVEAVSGSGIGGVSRAHVSRANGLQLGAVQFSNIIAEFSSAKKGAFADPTYAGNVGGGLLKRYTVTFDYAHQALYFQPRNDVVPDTGTYDRAGIWLQAAHEGVKVAEVVPGGPASLAGLQAGDVIVSLDGSTLSSTQLGALRYRFRNDPPGTQLAVIVIRNGAEHAFKLVLQNQI
jgi:PDZ domain/Aspartyl protease